MNAFGDASERARKAKECLNLLRLPSEQERILWIGVRRITRAILRFR